MTGKRIGYVRVSTVDQNPERQLEGIQLDKKFTDYASGHTKKRPELQSMLEYVREDDIIIVHSMDRLARNAADLFNLVKWFQEKKIQVQFVKENLVFNNVNNPMSNLLMGMLACIAEFELERIRERIREGVAIAKKKGTYKGRPSRLNKEMEEKIKSYLEIGLPKTKIAKTLSVSRFSLYRYLKQMGITQKNE